VGGQGLGQVSCGLVDRQSVDRGPEVEGVACGLPGRMETSEDALGEVDRERTVTIFGGVVQRTRAATLRAGALHPLEVAQVLEHLCHRHITAKRAEVEASRPTAGGLGLRRVVSIPAGGPAFLTPCLPCFFEFPIALGVDHLL